MGSADINRAVRLNRQYRLPRNLGWGEHEPEIVRILGNGGSASRSEYDFAKTVEIWQERQGFSPRNCDGIIGPDTWTALQRYLVPRPDNQTTAVIVVPSQGHSASQFANVATYLRRQVFEEKAIVVKTTVGYVGPRRRYPNEVVYCEREIVDPVSGRRQRVSCPVDLNTSDGHRFAFAEVGDLATVIVICHGGSDGPNLASRMGGHQPWGRNVEGTGLVQRGQAFWSSVGNALADDGKIILLGCFMGHTYAGLVARAAGKRAYGARADLAAARRSTAIRHVRAIERGRILSPMREHYP